MFYNLRNILNKKINLGELAGIKSLLNRVSHSNFPKTIACCQKSLKIFLNSSHFLTIALYFCLALGFIANSKLSPARQFDSHFDIQPAGATLISTTAEPTASSSLYDVDDETNYKQIAGKLHAGDTLSASFKRHHINDELRLQIIRALEGHLDFRDLRPNDHYSITLDDKGDLIKCVYESGPLTIYTITRTPEGFQTEQLQIPLACQTVKISGTIQGSLFSAFMQYDEDPKLIYAFADIFASQIDFNTETRNGDRFNIVFEKYYKDDQFVGYGKILVAKYETIDGDSFEGFYYSSENTPGSYFDAMGRELGSSFIRSPVPMGRVTSGFTFHRKHPISGVVRPHLGVDLAAPTGTPVMAVADGRVTFANWNGGYGKQVILRHANGYKTYYGHLSRFAKGITPGVRVKQKQIIGYIGSTGVATGPHLDYRIQYNATFKNPFAMKFKPKSILEGKELKLFTHARAVLADLMLSLEEDHKVIQVKDVTITPETEISFL